MKKELRTRRAALVAGSALMLVLAGCESLGFKWPSAAPPPEPKPPPMPAVAQDAVTAGSIGAVTYFADVDPLPVRGFGVVVGLGENGSSDCPAFVRDHLIEIMSKERETWADPQQRRKFSPAELIDSPSTAVVEISGLVPVGAMRGTTFDVIVRAIPGTSTRSLAGGLLLLSELHVTDLAGNDEALLATRVVGRASGPIFVNPFTPPEGRAAGEALRTGYVLSGGQSTDERKFRLLLRDPSYPLVQRLRTRINERFGQRPPVADATSRGYLTLKMPADFARHRADYLRLLPHIYVDGNAAFIESKLRDLITLATQPGADLDGISLAWEGIGATVLPSLKAFYAHRDARLRFYAARAGLRLKDADAVAVMGELAGISDRDIALLAARELGRCGYPRAAVYLRPLLDSSDQELRIAAYEELLNYSPPVIQTHRYPHLLDPLQLNLVLDVVESNGRPLIYVRRTGMPRIAIFGQQLPVSLPVFYTDADDSVTVNAVGDSGDLTVLTKRYKKMWDPLYVPPRVAELIGALADLPVKNQVGGLRGIGLPYSQVVQVLSALSRDGSITAPLEIEQVSLTELFGPGPEPERAEAEPPDADKDKPAGPTAAPITPPAGGRPETDAGPGLGVRP